MYHYWFIHIFFYYKKQCQEEREKAVHSNDKKKNKTHTQLNEQRNTVRQLNVIWREKRKQERAKVKDVKKKGLTTYEWLCHAGFFKLDKIKLVNVVFEGGRWDRGHSVIRKTIPQPNDTRRERVEGCISCSFRSFQCQAMPAEMVLTLFKLKQHAGWGR